ncbi:hypothetical protein HYDPIDRAFT_24312 [Hydnomerulius pinastri MD-312]|nr:hypothetical protein HYDPIDRAFT_24312 [Hydnomerulius pinastri MD-312]
MSLHSLPNKTFSLGTLRNLLEQVNSNNFSSPQAMTRFLKEAVKAIENRPPEPEPVNEAVETLRERIALVSSQNSLLQDHNRELRRILDDIQQSTQETRTVLKATVPFVAATGALLGALGAHEVAERFNTLGLRVGRVAHGSAKERRESEEPSRSEVTPPPEPLSSASPTALVPSKSGSVPPPARSESSPSPRPAASGSRSGTLPTSAPSRATPAGLLGLSRQPHFRQQGALNGEISGVEIRLICDRGHQPVTASSPAASPRQPTRSTPPLLPRADPPSARDLRQLQGPLSAFAEAASRRKRVREDEYVEVPTEPCTPEEQNKALPSAGDTPPGSPSDKRRKIASGCAASPGSSSKPKSRDNSRSRSRSRSADVKKLRREDRT